MIQLLCQPSIQTSTSASPARISQTTSRSAAQPETGRRALSLYPFALPSLLYPLFPSFPLTLALKPHIFQHEVQAEYALQACLKISSENLHSVHPLQAPTTAYLAHHQTWQTRKSVWVENCRSWYKSPPGKPDGRVQLHCGSMLHLLKTLRAPRWEDYVIERKEEEGNMWAFLGNGRVELEVLAENGSEGVDYAPYVRNADVPWSVDLLLSSTPA